ncbi:hypothetical protein FOA52_004997 [Chlamydomonas sp. UWO 241]|nr:hypothetical protein FOA52_004997 [Chlamydomonas sp. UWO 241]
MATLPPEAALPSLSLDDDEAEEHATAVAHSVLFSDYLWRLQLWRWMDRGSKNALRGVSVAMCAQVEGAISAAASPDSGFFSSADLSHALATMTRCTGLCDLTLLNVSAASAMQPLSTASLTGVTRLTMREAPAPGGGGLYVDQGSAWYLPIFSSGLAASLQVIDVSYCGSLTSIDAVRGCVQLRCLRMPGCVRVSDLSPLGACSQLEELWMAHARQITTLAPLKACPGLSKLDIRDCRPELHGQVGDLACTQLADPKTVEVEGLVHGLQTGMPPGVQQAAAIALKKLAHISTLRCAENRTAIAAAGAIPLLVLLLGQQSSEGAQGAAAEALTNLACDAANKVAIVAAGAIPPLILMLGLNSSEVAQVAALGALSRLAAGDAENLPTTASAAVEILKLLRDSSDPVQVAAAKATLKGRNSSHPENQAIIVAAGAIPPLVQLLGQHNSERMHIAAMGVLRKLGSHDAKNQAIIVAAGAIPPLVQLLGQQSSEHVHMATMGTLNCLGMVMADISSAGAIPHLVRLQGLQSSAGVRATAGRVLRRLKTCTLFFSAEQQAA